MSSATARTYVFALLSIACGLAASAQTTTVPNPDRFEADIRAFEAWDRQNAFPRGAVVFVGSSSIRMWPTAESFPDVAVINRGFGGSHVSDVNHFTERIVVKYRPRLIVFYAGDNDIAANKSPQQVFDDFRTFVQRVLTRLPSTRILYLPIKPSVARWPMWPKMQATNKLVAELAKSDNQLDYVDTATPMLGRDGQPRRELFLDDGLHLNDKGYAVWSAVLAPMLMRPLTEH
jgi:lysophospholipase L1-like esterase